MLIKGKPVPRGVALACALLVLLGLYLFLLGKLPKNTPAKVSLVEAHAIVAWVEKGGSRMSSVKFGLVGDYHEFTYSARNGDIGAVLHALASAGATPVGILFDPDSPTGPIYSDRRFHSVYQL